MLTRGFEFKNEKVFDGCKIIESRSSLLAVAKKEIILPTEKKIILLEQATDEEKKLFDSITNGSLIL